MKDRKKIQKLKTKLRKKFKKGKLLQEPVSFSNLFWFAKYPKKDILEVAAINNLCCMCFLETTPIQAAVYFHSKDKYFA